MMYDLKTGIERMGWKMQKTVSAYMEEKINKYRHVVQKAKMSNIL